MTIQEFIAVWQARPFRAFRLHTDRGVFAVNHPLGAAMTPRMRIAVVADGERAEIFSPEQVARCEIFGTPVDPAAAIGALAPEVLARGAQILSSAVAADAAAGGEDTPATLQDSGTIDLLTAYATDGVFIVHAAVRTRDGQPMFSTAGTRWNVHGLEQFENGTSLFLHHLDHPNVEQRVILWPPDKGTFESFAEAKNCAALVAELHERDAALAADPAKPVEHSPAYFEKIVPEFFVVEPDERAKLFGEDANEKDPDRFELVFEPCEISPGRVVKNPRIYDTVEEDLLFDLSGTPWQTSASEGTAPEAMTLQHVAHAKRSIELAFDFERQTARVDGRETRVPLEFVERHLRNFILYDSWDAMIEGLHAGPRKAGEPDAVLPAADGFRVELWSGEPRYAVPFLQPHIVDAKGRTVFDLRATTWSAILTTDSERPLVTLRFVGGEKDEFSAVANWRVVLDLVAHRVTCREIAGSTSLGMLQEIVRRVRTAKWMHEELPKWLEKGRALPVPDVTPATPPKAKKRAARAKKK